MTLSSTPSTVAATPAAAPAATLATNQAATLATNQAATLATNQAATLATNQDLDPSALRKAFGIFPTGVVAVAAVVDGRPIGLAASSFTSVSLDPPLVSFSIARTSKTWPDLRRAAHVGVTILAEQHGDVCRQLAGAVDERFDGLAVSASEDGALTLDEGLAQFDCTVYREVEAGDHQIVLLRLHAVAHTLGQPLVFHRSGFGRLAG